MRDFLRKVFKPTPEERAARRLGKHAGFWGGEAEPLADSRVDAAKVPFTVYRFAPHKRRDHATYVTIGLQELSGYELLAHADEDDEKFASRVCWLLTTLGCYLGDDDAPLQEMDTVPIGKDCWWAKRGYPFAALAPPDGVNPFDAGQLLQTTYLMVVPITRKERDAAVEKGTEAVFVTMQEDGNKPRLDRPALERDGQ